ILTGCTSGALAGRCGSGAAAGGAAGGGAGAAACGWRAGAGGSGWECAQAMAAAAANARMKGEDRMQHLRDSNVGRSNSAIREMLHGAQGPRRSWSGQAWIWMGDMVRDRGTIVQERAGTPAVMRTLRRTPERTPWSQQH